MASNPPDKDKEKLQTPAVTPKQIQLPTWKKTRVESPTNSSYYYIPGINKEELLGLYGKYFEEFKLQSPIISDPWEVTKSEEEKEDQEFTYQNLIPENPEVETPNIQTSQNPNLEHSEIRTPNIQTLPNQNNQNSDLINQQHILSEIIINQSVELIGQPLQQSAWINDIAKAITINNWDDARALQVIPYFLQDTTNFWYQNLINKLVIFNAFKTEFLRYFNNNNSINYLANTFTTMKQEETEAVTIYLRCFYRNLHQIQAIQTDYFTVPQILNQFIRSLHSSILQCVRSLHPADLQAAVTNTKDFEAAELEANHAQAVNLVINRSSELDSKLKQFTTIIENESLTTIFLFEIDKFSKVLLFSGATFEEKHITTMYMDAKVDVDCAASARIITADRMTKTPISKIDNFPIKVNGITISIKVLVMEAIHYQALVGNDWLSKTNVMLD
ncbi:hypothetical protein G9A89_012728 [Geosiphon pyriformis]|nr:hypothetical protein G9A89_012728 [Geosiphon pyriformis]